VIRFSHVMMSMSMSVDSSEVLVEVRVEIGSDRSMSRVVDVWDLSVDDPNPQFIPD
jgi:hypothetical protein